MDKLIHNGTGPHPQGAITNPAPGYTAEMLLADYPEGTCEVCAEEDLPDHPDFITQEEPVQTTSLEDLEARVIALEGN